MAFIYNLSLLSLSGYNTAIRIYKLVHIDEKSTISYQIKLNAIKYNILKLPIPNVSTKLFNVQIQNNNFVERKVKRKKNLILGVDLSKWLYPFIQ